MKFPFLGRPKPATRRRPPPSKLKRLGVRLATLLSDADTYVFCGLTLMSLAIGALVALRAGAGYGMGAGSLTFGSGLFGLGIWLLPPRATGEE